MALSPLLLGRSCLPEFRRHLPSLSAGRSEGCTAAIRGFFASPPLPFVSFEASPTPPIAVDPVGVTEGTRAAMRGSSIISRLFVASGVVS